MQVSVQYLDERMNFLSSDDLPKSGFERIFEIAASLEKGGEELFLKPNSVLLIYFEKPSTRTRVSLGVAITQLGGSAIEINSQTTQLSRGETIADTARMMGSYVDFVALRLYKHTDLLEFANYCAVPVINALTDLEHPTQALADVYTILKHTKNIKKTKIAFMGDVAANTANSLMITAAKMGAEVALIGPKGYSPNPSLLTKAMEYSKVVVTDSKEEGLADADIIYTDTFISMGQETESQKRRALFAPYQVNKEAVALAKEDVLVMHCLPAHRGEEITADVIDSTKSIVWEQARNKLLLSKALLLYLSEHAKK